MALCPPATYDYHPKLFGCLTIKVKRQKVKSDDSAMNSWMMKAALLFLQSLTFYPKVSDIGLLPVIGGLIKSVLKT
jgi:predicted solute-binding protein